ncbi:MAG: hypothetical protein CMB55_07855 [Euryarchaeota archaeon]|nr:hypothetical protein [Euryarchaeota archaeon]
MIQAILPIVGDLAGSWLKGKAEEKAAVAKTRIAKAEAEAEIMKVAATSEASWEKVMAKGSVNSWKDEWLTVLFSIPLILAFCGDWGREIVSNGFAALEAMPDYYQYTLGVIVSASFAVRSATKFFGKR